MTVVHPEDVATQARPALRVLAAMAAAQLGPPERAKQIVDHYGDFGTELLRQLRERFDDREAVLILCVALGLQVEQLLQAWEADRARN